MSEAEGRTMVVAGAVLLLVSALRWGWEVRAEPLTVPGDTAVAVQLLEASREELEEAEARKRPLGEDEKLDPNRASAAQLDRLPGVGPSVARAIVEERETGGYFEVAGDLGRVRGIGPATVGKIAPHLDFRRPPPARAVTGDGRRARRHAASSRVVPEEVPGIDVNAADEVELQKLPGVGPVLAHRIAEYRGSHGPFRRPEDLLEVPGIGPATLERLRNRLSLRP